MTGMDINPGDLFATHRWINETRRLSEEAALRASPANEMFEQGDEMPFERLARQQRAFIATLPTDMVDIDLPSDAPPTLRDLTNKELKQHIEMYQRWLANAILELQRRIDEKVDVSDVIG